MDLKIREEIKKSELYDVNLFSIHHINSSEVDSNDCQEKFKVVKREKFFDFYICNLDTSYRKEEINSEFSKYGIVKEISVKKSSLTKYFLAFIRIENSNVDSEEIIKDLFRKYFN
jgi:RNA recognition motif-containing protein